MILALLHLSGEVSAQQGTASGAAAGTDRPLVNRRDATHWYFGANAGISFESGAAIEVRSGQVNTLEGSSVISDPVTGDLLFYTDGMTVWNRNHEVMPNGWKLKGFWTSAQSALIVPKPGDLASFYIFTVGAGPYHTATPNNMGFRYSTVDMRLAGGMGDVVEKNVWLMDSTTEQLTATRHCNGRDYWVVVHRYRSSEFHAYLVTAEGVAAAPVTSSVGTPGWNEIDYGGYGQGTMRIAPNGRLLASAMTYDFHAALFDFDNSTGIVSNERILASDPPFRFYSPAFSPDNSKLYIATLADPSSHPSALFQYDLAAGSPDAIRSSRKRLSASLYDGWVGGQLQLAPDGRIYHSEYRSRTSLGVIYDPNKPYPDCGYAEGGFSLQSGTLKHGLPNLIDSDIFGVVNGFSKMSVRQTVDTPTPWAGGDIEYAITVCNEGGEAADAMIEERLPEGVEYVGGFDPYPYHTVVALGPRECRTVTLKARVALNSPVGVPLNACASVTDQRCQAPIESCVPVTARDVNIAVTKSVTEEDLPRAHLVYTIRVANTRLKRATNVVVRDILPDDVEYVSHSTTPGATFDTDRCELVIPVLEVGSAVSLELTVRVLRERFGEIVNCAELVALDQIDGESSDNRDCAGIIFCPGGAVIGSASIDRSIRAVLATPAHVPIVLDAEMDSARLTRIRIIGTYDPETVRLEHDDPRDLTRGTLLEGWLITLFDDRAGVFTLEFVAPFSDRYLKGSGDLLNLRFRAFLGRNPGSDLDFRIEIPEDSCNRIMTEPGYISLDSICGLSLRLIEAMPESFALLPNVPNPFNPSTEIRFSIGLDGPATLVVHDASGGEVAKLVDEYLMPGTYVVPWDASAYPSGLYYYRLTSGTWSETRPMMLVK